MENPSDRPHPEPVGGTREKRRLIVHGAREHNLKDITVRLPRNRLVCITGLSGSGKSSLAFDTIYAEGQRRYVESLSAYARQFLQMMEKPDVDSIDGLVARDLDRPEDDVAQPALDRRHRHRDLRLPAPALRARRPPALPGLRPARSPARASSRSSTRSCACPRGRASPSTPGRRDRKGEYRGRLRGACADGFTRVKVDGEQRLLEDDDRARQEVQAHDRGRRRPARDEAGPARHAPARSRSRRPSRSPRASSPSTSSTTASTLTFSERFACPSTASRCPSSSRGSSRSTRRTAPARAARASARSRRSTRTCSSRPDPRSPRARSCRGRSATRPSTSP